MEKLILLITCCCLTACAPTQWCPTSSGVNFERDRRECMTQAGQYANAMGTPGNPFIIISESRDCLREKGYYICQQ